MPLPFFKSVKTAELTNSELEALHGLCLLLSQAQADANRAEQDQLLPIPDFAAYKQQLVKAFAEAWQTPSAGSACRDLSNSPATTKADLCSTAGGTQGARYIALCSPQLLPASRAALLAKQQQLSLDAVGLQPESSSDGDSSSGSWFKRMLQLVPLQRQSQAAAAAGSETPALILKEMASRGGVSWSSIVTSYEITAENMLQRGWMDPNLLAAYGVTGRDLLTVPGFCPQTLINARPRADELKALNLTAQNLSLWLHMDRRHLPALWITSQQWLSVLGLNKHILSSLMKLDAQTAQLLCFHRQPHDWRWRVADLAAMGYTQQELQQLGLIALQPQPPQSWPPAARATSALSFY